MKAMSMSELVGASMHMPAQADGTKAELDEGQHQHGVLHPEAGRAGKVVQVVAVGVEGRTGPSKCGAA